MAPQRLIRRWISPDTSLRYFKVIQGVESFNGKEDGCPIARETLYHSCDGSRPVIRVCRVMKRRELVLADWGVIELGRSERYKVV